VRCGEVAICPSHGQDQRAGCFGSAVLNFFPTSVYHPTLSLRCPRNLGVRDNSSIFTITSSIYQRRSVMRLAQLATCAGRSKVPLQLAQICAGKVGVARFAGPLAFFRIGTGTWVHWRRFWRISCASCGVFEFNTIYGTLAAMAVQLDDNVNH
jgi:hypothetical protein